MNLVILSTGQDQSSELQAIYDQAHDGDTIELVPQNGNRFIVGTPLNWTSTKRINVKGWGSILYAANAQNLAVTFGAPLGARNSGYWSGGSVYGNLAIQNLGYSKLNLEGITGTLILNCDTVIAYNTFEFIGGISGGVNLTCTGSGWSNKNTFRDTAIHNTLGPAVFNFTTPNTAPSVWLFDNCDFEANQALFNTGTFDAQFRSCYFEGAWTIGTTGPGANFTFTNLSEHILDWALDPRIHVDGAIL